MSFAHVPHIIPVLSGKGGVGKSSVTVQLALALSLAGRSVGVLDIDLTGPSIPRLFGIEEAKIKQSPGGWLPVTVHEACSGEDTDGEEPKRHGTGALYCLSLGFLLPARGDAVVWRGPKKTAMVKQLLSDVLWPKDLEVLLVDTPPGTSDEHIALVTELLSKVTPASRLGAVMVTTPQKVATSDVRKELSFCKTVGLKVLGVVENMAGFVCPCCGEVTQIFRAPAADEEEEDQRREGGGEAMAREWGVGFLASVPLDGECWALLVEQGKRPVYQKAVRQTDTRQDNGHQEDVDDDDDNDDDLLESDVSELPQIQPDPGRLVDKYTDSKLFGIFQEMARRVLEDQALTPTGP